jgi:hypothetical protein
MRRRYAQADYSRDDGLGELLATIAADIQRQAGAVADSIRSEFAIKMQDARRRAPRHQLAAILRALQDAQATALTVAARNAQVEIRGRQRAAIAARPGRRKRPGSRPTPSAR